MCDQSARGLGGVDFLQGTQVDSSLNNVMRTRQVTNNLKKTSDGRYISDSSVFDPFVSCTSIRYHVSTGQSVFGNLKTIT